MILPIPDNPQYDNVPGSKKPNKNMRQFGVAHEI